MNYGSEAGWFRMYVSDINAIKWPLRIAIFLAMVCLVVCVIFLPTIALKVFTGVISFLIGIACSLAHAELNKIPAIDPEL